MLTNTVIGTLHSIVGSGAVFTDDETRERCSFDALGPYRLFERRHLTEHWVDAVVRPATTGQVSAVVRLAGEHGAAVVPYGGGTGVMGAVIPLQGGIALDLRGMDAILEVRAADRLARVQPGVVLADLEREAEGHGLMLGHDPWCVPTATDRGAISTDSVGYRASKYGSMGQQVSALEVVLANGEVVRTRPVARPSSGPSLNGLFVGAEGSMGVITEATVQLYPQPEERAFATLGFASFEAGFPVVAKLFDLGLVPALVDLSEEEPPTGGFPCVLYLGFEGYREEVEAQRSRALHEGVASVARTWVQAPPNSTGRRGINGRNGGATRCARCAPPSGGARPIGAPPTIFNLSLPVSGVLDYKRRAEGIVQENGLAVHEAAVWTDPRLFSLLVVDPQSGRDDRQAVLATAVEELLTLAQAMGGGIEYCHGIGAKLAPLMERRVGRCASPGPAP